MADDWAGAALIARNNAVEWQNYARRLEADLLACQANKAGVTAVKDAALSELARLDPRNHLLVQKNRQRIFDVAFEPIATGKRAA